MFIRAMLILLATVGASGAAHGAFLVTTTNATADPGDSITLNVSISGPERLDWFGLELILTPLDGSPNGGVRFVVDGSGLPANPVIDPSGPPVDAPVGTPAGPNPIYGFRDNSFVYGEYFPDPTNPSKNPASVLATNWTGDTYIFSDATLDFAGVDVIGGKLLTQLSISSEFATPGSRYQVSIGPGSFFRDEFVNDIEYTSEGGIITFNGGEVNPVPGPSGALLAAIGSGILALGRLRFAAGHKLFK
jgi:hypothetical protein